MFKTKVPRSSVRWQSPSRNSMARFESGSSAVFLPSLSPGRKLGQAVAEEHFFGPQICQSHPCQAAPDLGFIWGKDRGLLHTQGISGLSRLALRRLLARFSHPIVFLEFLGKGMRCFLDSISCAARWQWGFLGQILTIPPHRRADRTSDRTGETGATSTREAEDEGSRSSNLS
jgi:hypothetical protein